MNEPRDPSPETNDPNVLSFSAWLARSEPLEIDPAEHCRTVLSGIVGSPGIAVGSAYIHTSTDLWIESHEVPEDEIEREIERFRAAVAGAIEDRHALQTRMEDLSRAEAQIFESHVMLLQDPALIEATENCIRTTRRNAESCFYLSLQTAIETISRFATDDLFRERTVDLDDIRSAVLRKLSGERPIDLSTIPAQSVIVAHGLTPSDTAQMPHDKVVGIVTDTGGPTSHASILSRSLGIPAVIGSAGATGTVMPGSQVIVDGTNGRIYIDPDDALRAQVENIRLRHSVQRDKLGALLRLPTETLDGHHVRLELNVELPGEIERAAACICEGVGLFRTEFLFMARDDWPCEEEQLDVYRRLATAFGERPVTIRTMDIGGDKLSRRLHVTPENNPFLGWRAIRISLAQPDVFRTQIAAVLRASAHGNIRLMFPLVTSVDEFREAMAHVADVRRDLDRRGEPYDAEMPVGVMIETPAAVMIADALAREARFFSIGTNDLVQYTLAVDRDNERVATLFDAYHPAVLRLIRETVEAGRRAGIEVFVCGEMANQPLATMLLVGLGVEGLSMAPGGIPEIKQLIRQFALVDARRISHEALEQVTGEDVRRILRAALAERGIPTF